MKPPRFVQLASDPKVGLVALAEDGTVWRFVPKQYDGAMRVEPARWEPLA